MVSDDRDLESQPGGETDRLMETEQAVRSPRQRLARTHSHSHPTTKEVHAQCTVCITTYNVVPSSDRILTYTGSGGHDVELVLTAVLQRHVSAMLGWRQCT